MNDLVLSLHQRLIPLLGPLSLLSLKRRQTLCIRARTENMTRMDEGDSGPCFAPSGALATFQR
jgi:hypothetical protein